MKNTFTAALAAVALILLGIGAAPAAAAPTVAIGGGSSILVLKGGNEANACTVTTIGRDGSGALVGLTAGHCGDPGNGVLAEEHQDAGSIATVVFKNAGMDYSVLRFDESKVRPTNSVGGLRITGIRTEAPRFGEIACKMGRTTGRTCGIVWTTLDGSHLSQICVAQGDSGAPVVVDGRLVGMVNAFYHLSCVGPETGGNIATILGDADSNGQLRGFHVI